MLYDIMRGRNFSECKERLRAWREYVQQKEAEAACVLPLHDDDKAQYLSPPLPEFESQGLGRLQIIVRILPRACMDGLTCIFKAFVSVIIISDNETLAKTKRDDRRGGDDSTPADDVDYVVFASEMPADDIPVPPPDQPDSVVYSLTPEQRVRVRNDAYRIIVVRAIQGLCLCTECRRRAVFGHPTCPVCTLSRVHAGGAPLAADPSTVEAEAKALWPPYPPDWPLHSTVQSEPVPIASLGGLSLVFDVHVGMPRTAVVSVQARILLLAAEGDPRRECARPSDLEGPCVVLSRQELRRWTVPQPHGQPICDLYEECSGMSQATLRELCREAYAAILQQLPKIRLCHQCGVHLVTQAAHPTPCAHCITRALRKRPRGA